MWSVSGGVQDEDRTVDSPKQLTVAMYFIIFTQLIKLRIPNFLVCLDLGIESKPNFFQLLNSFRIQFAFSEDRPLIANPTAQFPVFLVLKWHFTCNVGRDICGVLVGVFKMKVKQSAAQNNSQ
jgi:hypothetical protein